MFDHKHTRGFSLIELMVTVAVGAILLTVGVPSFQTFIQDSRLTTQSHDLRTALNYARTEAVRRAESVSVCRSNDQASCSGNWENGWIIFTDDDKDGSVDAADGDTLLRVSSGLEGSNTLRFSNAANYLGYDGEGFLYSNRTGTFTLCDARGAGDARGLEVAITGRARSVTGGLACP